MKKITITAIALMSVSFELVAKEKFKNVSTCGNAKVLSGTSCSNVKVELSFDNCELKSAPVIAQKIVCSKDEIKARHTEGDLRYEAQFKKLDDGFGRIEWQSLGAMSQLQREAEEVAVAKPKKKKSSAVPAQVSAAPAPMGLSAPSVFQPTPAPVVVRAPSNDEASKSNGLKISGFVDARLSSVTLSDKNQPKDGNPESGFGIEDGAIYMNLEEEKISFTLDVPFRRSYAQDSNAAAANGLASNTGAFALGLDKPQAFAKAKVTDTLSATVGQWDTIFGVELNDSKDRFFGKTGILYDLMLPVTHTGMLVEYNTGSFLTKIFSANSNNKGSLGDSGTGDNQYEYGLGLGYFNDSFHIYLNSMVRPILKADGTKTANRSLTDLIIGGNYGNFSIELEVASLNDPSKNTLTAADSSDNESAGIGYLVLPTYKIDDSNSIGIRYESLTDDPAQKSYKTASSAGLAVHRRINDRMQVRLEYDTFDYKRLDETTFKTSRVYLGSLLTF